MEWKDRRSATLEGEGYNRGDILSLTPVEREREKEKERKKGGEEEERDRGEQRNSLQHTRSRTT